MVLFKRIQAPSQDLGVVAASAGLIVLAFPPFELWPLVLLAPLSLGYYAIKVPLWKNKFRAALFFFAFRFLVLVLVGRWLIDASQSRHSIDLFVSFALLSGVAGVFSLPYLLFGWIWSSGSRLIESKSPGTLTLQCIWLFGTLWSVEYLLWQPLGFTYSLALAQNEDLLSAMYYLGTEGLGVIIFGFAATASLLLLTVGSSLRFALIPVVALLLLGTGVSLGDFAQTTLKARFNQRQAVALIQDNVVKTDSIYFKGDIVSQVYLLLESRRTLFRLYRDLRQRASSLEHELWAVTGETVLHEDIFGEQKRQSRASQSFKRYLDIPNTLHFVGGLEVLERPRRGHVSHVLHNTVSFFRGDQHQGLYRKMLPFPFGEYIPGGNLWPDLYPLFGLGIKVVPGKDHRVFPHPNKAGPVFVPLVCLEGVYRSHVFSAVAFARTRHPGRPIILVGLSNMAGFHSKEAEKLFSLLTRMQSTTLGLPFLRGSRTGLSEVVAPWGEVLASGPRNQELIVYGELPVVKSQPKAR